MQMNLLFSFNVFGLNVNKFTKGSAKNVAFIWNAIRPEYSFRLKKKTFAHVYVIVRRDTSVR